MRDALQTQNVSGESRARVARKRRSHLRKSLARRPRECRCRLRTRTSPALPRLDILFAADRSVHALDLRARSSSSLPAACCRRAATTTRSIGHSAGRFRRNSTSASRSATAGPSAIPTSSPSSRRGRTGSAQEVSYGWLRETSNRLANALAAHGVGRGDRVAILLPQAPEVAAIHIAIYKLGAIALPLAMLFGVEAISYRLAEFRRQGADHQRAGPRQDRAGARRTAGPATGPVARRAGRRRARISTRRSRAPRRISRRGRPRPTIRR